VVASNAILFCGDRQADWNWIEIVDQAIHRYGLAVSDHTTYKDQDASRELQQGLAQINSGSSRSRLRARTVLGRLWQAPLSKHLRWGTIVCRNIEERLIDETPSFSSFRTTQVSHPVWFGRIRIDRKILAAGVVKEFRTIASDPLVVLTGPCLKLESTGPCDTVTLGSNCLTKNSIFSPFSHTVIYDTRYSLPSRIASTLDIRARLTNALEELGATHAFSLWDQNTYDHKLTKAIRPLARRVIYRGSCVCLIHTAFLICE
jgi:hypothetical protein